MPKFCGYCGMQTDDAAFVCDNCGTPIQQQATQYQVPAQPVNPVPEQTAEYAQPVAPAQPVNDYQSYYNQQPQAPVKPAEKKKLNIDFNAIISLVTGKISEIIAGVKKGDKKSIITVGGVAAAVLAVLIVIISILSVGGEERAAKKVLKAIDNDKAESMVKLVPKFCFGESDLGFTKSESDWEDDFATRIDYFREDVADVLNSNSFNMKWEIADVDFFGDETLEDLSDAFLLYDDFKESKLKKGALVIAEAECKKGGEKYYSEIEIYAYKYGASWYVYTWSIKESVQN